MADLITAGMTGAQFIAALNVRKIFNVLDYGAVGNNSTVNTTVLQAVIELAHVNGGTVYIPSGTYKTGKLSTYGNVLIQGDGFSSILKSVAAEPLIESLSGVYQNGGLEYIALDGDNTGTIGYNIQLVNNFNMVGIYGHGFTNTALNLQGCLIGLFEGCNFSLNAIGITAAVSGVVAPNLVSLKNCVFNSNTVYGIKWLNGLMLRLENCDFEFSGTSSDNSTGAIYYKGSHGATGSPNIGLSMDSCWFETNHGINVNLVEPTVNTEQLSTIRNCMFKHAGGDVSVDINIVGATTGNKLILDSCCIHNTANLIINGANASVINNHSILSGTITKSNSGTYYTTDITAA